MTPRNRDGLVANVRDILDAHAEVRYPHVVLESIAADLLAVVERERTDDPACSDPTCSYRAELAFQRERPSLTEEDWKTVHWCMIVAESRAINGMDVTVRELRNRLWRAFAASTTEERYEAAERLRRRQDDPRTQERSLSAWREEDESHG